jgi:UDP-2-acetamido-3-amino-2,3-dideoxy-glucuronate N-acetyltransferase
MGGKKSWGSPRLEPRKQDEREKLNNNQKMTSKQHIRDLALIGAGYWGKNLARNFNELGVLHTICDRSEELLNNFKTEAYSETNLTSSIETVLQDPSITKVAIAVPAAYHYEVALAVLNAGKDVFVEKPLCLDVTHAEELVALAKELKRILMVGHLLQYHPCIRKLQDMVQSGELGKLFYLTSNRLNLGKIRREENALWSFAPHDISVILSLVGYRPPKEVRCIGAAYLNERVADITLTTLKFENGTRAHIHVGWLNPFKEQKLIVVGSNGMVVFDDTKTWGEKLIWFKDYLTWQEGKMPVPNKQPGVTLEVEEEEPLRNECFHFLECCDSGKKPKTDGDEGLISLQVLAAAQRSLENGGEKESLEALSISNQSDSSKSKYFAHPTSVIDEGCKIGSGTNIWHFSHVMNGAELGQNCNVGQNVVVSSGVKIGNGTKIQNNISLYSGLETEQDVFLGPSCVFTNISNPRSQVSRKTVYEKTTIKRGATVGANATILCGVTLGRYCFVGAGAVVTKDVPDYALVLGNPAKNVGWMSRHGHRLKETEKGYMVCPESGLKYELTSEQTLRCLDLNEDQDLPEHMSASNHPYRHFSDHSNSIPAQP